jgi:hypothetical protein
MPSWIDIPCPVCGSKIQTVNGEAVRYIRIDKASCACGFSGLLEWVNPHLGDSLIQERALLESQRSIESNVGR